MPTLRHLLTLVLLLVPFARALALEAAPNALSAEERAAGWRVLFDGKTTQGWRSFAGAPVGSGWRVENGELVRAEKGAGDIVTDGEYGAFEMMVDYKISPGGNSGLMFHVTDAGKMPWQTGPEIQIQDNKGGHDPQLAGWLYQLYKPETDATRPAGEWNQIRILITPQKCATWMNGTLYYEYVKGSKDWDERVAKSKFASMPHFGKPTSGRICLQDHGNVVSFRNIKIRPVTP
jgi:hypothetical protein